MKQIHLLCLIALLAACSQPKDHFVLRGYVPGAMDSTKVKLWNEDQDIQLSGYVVNEQFELTGKAPLAMYCHLSMNDSDVALKGQEDANMRYVEANFFVENGNLEFSVPHIDSLPQSFWRYDIRKENNYTLKGSASQEVFDCYRRKTMDLQCRISHETRLAQKEKREPDGKALAALNNELRQATRDFIAENRNLPVNLHLAQFLEMEPFTYTQADLDAMTSLFAGYTDTLSALQAFRAKYEKASAYTKGTPFAGGRVCTPQGDTINLKDAVKPGQYTLIDFWASWCGPCRASFPHLRKVHTAHGKEIAFLSVSLDKNNADWQKAMKEEQLPWQQFIVTKSFSREMDKLYQLTSVPTFLIIDPAGKIIFSGHESGELDVKLEEMRGSL